MYKSVTETIKLYRFLGIMWALTERQFNWCTECSLVGSLEIWIWM